MEEEKTCYGCGVVLQSEDPEKIGYIPDVKFETPNPLCKRCYRILHYGEPPAAKISGGDYWMELDKMLRFAKAVIYVVDAGDFEGSWSDELVDKCRKHPIFLVVNKIDILPTKLTEEEVRRWLALRLGSKIKLFRDVIFASAKVDCGIERIIKSVFDKIGKGNIIFAGATNVGKSSLINKLICHVGNGKNNCLPVTESKFPGTTLRRVLISIPGSKVNIWDSPGVPVKGRAGDYLCAPCASALLSPGEISRKTFKLREGGSIILGGVGYFTVLEGANRPILQCFAPQTVRLHQTSKEKVRQIITKYGGQWLKPPCLDCIKQLTDKLGWAQEQFEMEEGEDLVISGLGWISMRRGPAKIEVTVPKGIKVVKRPAFIAPKEE